MVTQGFPRNPQGVRVILAAPGPVPLTTNATAR
jgi:hypothetical protein